GVLQPPGMQAAFRRRDQDVQTGPDWGPPGALPQIDAVTVGLLVTLTTDEEGQLDRDELLVRATPFDVAAGAAAGPGVAFPLPPPAVEALRNPGPLKQDPAAVREWLTPAKDVRAWIAWLATSGLQTPSLTEPWEQGKLPFVNDAGQPALGAPQ